MTCPVCKQSGARRSRRQNLADYILSALGVFPWRCQNCHARFHSRLMPLNYSFYAHCPICGNLGLKRISGEYVNSTTAFLWRMLRVPAFRCDPCRYKYFSILPLHENREDEAQVPTGD